ncbi:MAG TPA: sensor histidine kinase [Streptosporangiaceae bacterium]
MDPVRVPLLRPLRPAQLVAIDCAATALLALASAVIFREAAYLPGIPRWAAALVIAAGVLPAAFRRRWPRSVLALVVLSAAVATAISTSPGPVLAVAFVIYLIPLRRPRREALWLLAATLLAVGAGMAVFLGGPHVTPLPGAAAGLLLASWPLVAIAWLIGYAAEQQRSHAAAQREQAERRAREQLTEARRARSEERLQIARELHDVVAHTMSLIAVQAGVANYVASTRPDEAARALASIEETSRGALGEMRALLGMLRADESAAAPVAAVSLVPTPGLADLDGLVKRTAEAGVRVTLDVCGERPPLSAGLELAAYRVIQEAITNVIRHAATDSCQVTVTYQREMLLLAVTDSGTGHGAANHGAANHGAANRGGNGRGGDGRGGDGHGIAGMRERVQMYGGELQAAPLPGRGFRVTARFPLAGAAA